MDDSYSSPMQHVPATPQMFPSQSRRINVIDSPMATVPDFPSNSTGLSPVLLAGEVPATPHTGILRSSRTMHSGTRIYNMPPESALVGETHNMLINLATVTQCDTPQLGSCTGEQIVPCTPLHGNRCPKTSLETPKQKNCETPKSKGRRFPRVLSPSPRPSECKSLELFSGEDIFA